jgi:hypothetical protein
MRSSCNCGIRRRAFIDLKLGLARSGSLFGTARIFYPRNQRERPYSLPRGEGLRHERQRLSMTICAKRARHLDVCTLPNIPADEGVL